MTKRNAKNRNDDSENYTVVEQAISDVKGLEKLQVMQLTMIREIRRQLQELAEKG